MPRTSPGTGFAIAFVIGVLFWSVLWISLI